MIGNKAKIKAESNAPPLPRALAQVPALIVRLDRHLRVVFSSLDGHTGGNIRVSDLGIDIDRRLLEQAMAGQEVAFSTSYVDAGGKIQFFENTYRPSAEAGVAIYIVNVTGRESALRELRESDERFRRLMRVIPYGISRTDLTGRLRMSNPAHDKMLGYEPGELEGRSVWEMFEPSQQDSQREFFFQAIKQRPEPAPNLGKCLRKDGSLVDVKFHWAYEIDDDGELMGFISILTDVTQELMVQRELEAAKLDAERASEEKSRFLAAASHDLQQPLHSLSLMVGVLRETHDEKRREEILNQMVLAVDGAQALLRAVLDLSKLEAGVIKPRRVPVSVADLLAQIEAEFAPLAAESKVALRVVPTTAVILSDPILIKSIMHNLVSNALRYTKRGKVLIGARRHQGQLSLQVWDTGIGIPKDKQREIFKEFTRLQTEQHGIDKVHALGLGLSIVERACLLLGHQLTLHSEVGKGSVFCILAPQLSATVRRQKPRPLPAATPHSADGDVVLVLEDDAVTARQTVDLLKAWGFVGVIATSSTEAEAMARQKSQRLDLILADYNLGAGHNGIEALTRIQKLRRRRIPAILITSEDSAEFHQEMTRKGIEMLPKPVSPARLRALMDYLLGAKPRVQTYK
ncbi:MAG: PAS domain S-box protein [Sphingomonadales bacterium]|nr:PAS domain S-box protein [Sphingomonadales bacterium]